MHLLYYRECKARTAISFIPPFSNCGVPSQTPFFDQLPLAGRFFYAQMTDR